MAKGTRVSNDTRTTSLRLHAEHLKVSKSVRLRKAVARRRGLSVMEVTSADVLREAVILGLHQLQGEDGSRERIEALRAFKRYVLPLLEK